MADHPVPLLPDHPRLLPGLRVLRRDAAHLQVGVGARAVLVPDHPDVRRLLGLLTSGAAPAAEHLPRPHTPAGEVLARLAGAGLLVDGAALQTELHRSDADPAGDPAAVAAAWCSDPGTAPQRWATRGRAQLHLDVPTRDRPGLERLVAACGLSVAPGPGDRSTATGSTAGGAPVLVVREQEPAREELDRLQRDDVPHLLVRSELDRVVLGPFVAPGRTACVRCLDAHAADLDPRWPLLVEQLGRASTGATPSDPAPRDPALWQVALGWAVHDLVRWSEGRQPSTWSTTVTLGSSGSPQVQVHRRHPRCGCGWADLGAAGRRHQKSESSLPSIERRFSREQVSQ
jgi:bacteriocin biosynthesis cyclodehydratase domain-containing protein